MLNAVCYLLIFFRDILVGQPVLLWFHQKPLDLEAFYSLKCKLARCRIQTQTHLVSTLGMLLFTCYTN